jgi:HK97 family phage major capsid protein
MAITAASTLSSFSDFSLTPAQAGPIFDDAARQSVVQRLSRRVPMGLGGAAVPVTTTRPVANWVSEANPKPATAGGRALLTMEPKKLAALLVASAEVVRADPAGYITSARADLAEAFAVAFDYAALYGLGGDGTGSGPFDDAIADTTKSVTFGTAVQDEGGIHADVVAGLSLLVEDGKRLTGFAFDDVAEPVFLTAVDANGRPIYIDTPLDETTRVSGGRLIGRPSFMGQGVGNGDTVGFGGDWSKVAWGAAGGISFDTSTEASVTINGELVSAFENNLVIIRAEAEYGFLVGDVDAFVAYEAGSS